MLTWMFKKVLTTIFGKAASKLFDWLIKLIEGSPWVFGGAFVLSGINRALQMTPSLQSRNSLATLWTGGLIGLAFGVTMGAFYAFAQFGVEILKSHQARQMICDRAVRGLWLGVLFGASIGFLDRHSVHTSKFI